MQNHSVTRQVGQSDIADGYSMKFACPQYHLNIHYLQASQNVCSHQKEQDMLKCAKGGGHFLRTYFTLHAKSDRIELYLRLLLEEGLPIDEVVI